MKSKSLKNILIYISTHILAVAIILIVIFATLKRNKEVDYANNIYTNSLKMIKDQSGNNVDTLLSYTYDESNDELVIGSFNSSTNEYITLSLSTNNYEKVVKEMSEKFFSYKNYTRTFNKYVITDSSISNTDIKDNKVIYKVFNNGTDNYISMTYLSNDNNYISISNGNYDMITHQYISGGVSNSISTSTNNTIRDLYKLIIEK